MTIETKKIENINILSISNILLFYTTLAFGIIETIETIETIGMGSDFYFCKSSSDFHDKIEIESFRNKRISSLPGYTGGLSGLKLPDVILRLMAMMKKSNDIDEIAKLTDFLSEIRNSSIPFDYVAVIM